MYDTRWLEGHLLTDREVENLTEFYMSCNAAEVCDGQSFAVSFTDTFIEKVEHGRTGLEGTKTFPRELISLEHLPGDFLTVGMWPVSELRCPHRRSLFKQMPVDGKAPLLCFRTKTGWCMSDTLDICLDKDGFEVAADMSAAWCYPEYTSNSGKTVITDCSEYPRVLHWPDWRGEPCKGITITDTGVVEAADVKLWKEAEQEREAADGIVTLPDVEPAVGLQGVLYQRYAGHLKRQGYDVDSERGQAETLASIFTYCSKKLDWSRCSSLSRVIVKQADDDVPVLRAIADRAEELSQLPFTADYHWLSPRMLITMIMCTQCAEPWTDCHWPAPRMDIDHQRFLNI